MYYQSQQILVHVFSFTVGISRSKLLCSVSPYEKMSSRISWIRVFLCPVIFTSVLKLSTSSSIETTGLSLVDLTEIVEQLESQNLTTRGARDEPEITLIGFLQQSVKKYGEKKVAMSIHELAQRSLYDLMWMLAGDLEPWLIVDLYKAYSHANSDAAVQSVYERFKAGQVNRTIVPEVFALDKKYNQFDWWRRVRTRMLISVDKYMTGTLAVNNAPPKIEFTPDGRPIIAGNNGPVTAVEQPIASNSITTTTEDSSDGEDPDDEDTEDSDLSDLFASLI